MTVIENVPRTYARSSRPSISSTPNSKRLAGGKASNHFLSSACPITAGWCGGMKTATLVTYYTSEAKSRARTLLPKLSEIARIAATSSGVRVPMIFGDIVTSSLSYFPFSQDASFRC